MNGNGHAVDASTFEGLALAGNATITLVNKADGERFTYRIRQKKGADFWFVSVLSGSDNTGDYRYLGCLPNGGRFCPAKAGKGVAAKATSSRAFAYVWGNRRAPWLGQHIEVWHEGKCCRCGRKLTVPTSIATGLGPHCAAHVEGAA